MSARVMGGAVVVGSERLWHGGDLGEARRLFPGAAEPWIDLSTGINPVPYPVGDLPVEAFARLPAPADLEELEGVAAEAYGASPGSVVAAPGTQALIELLPRLRPAGRVVAVVGPTYAEHARAWRKAGHAVVEAGAPAATGDAEVVVVGNPNNPDGRTWRRDELEAVARRLAARAGWLVVDEAFADLEPVESLAPAVPGGVVVLRSFGKTFGLGGLRLGFAVTSPALVARIREASGPWPVSGPAIALGRRALADRAWLETARRERGADARRLDALLAPMTIPVGGTRLFRTVESGGAPELFGRLGAKGIWVRRFQDDPRRLRFGLPGPEADWRRLEAALGASA